MRGVPKNRVCINTLPCVVNGCDRKRECKSYCHRHYELFRRSGGTTPRKAKRTLDDSMFPPEPTVPQATCLVDGCDAPKSIRGLCQRHYSKVHASGTLEFLKQPNNTHNGNRWVQRLWSRYQMRPDDYLGILEAQDGHCALCPATSINGKPLFVDHDHSTGEVRGLLCARCNTTVGYFEKGPIHDAALYVQYGGNDWRRKARTA